MTNPAKVTLRDTILNDVLIHELECGSSLYDEPCDCIQQNVADRIITTVIRELEGRLPEVTDLDSPLQQSWKLGGTDETSYKHGYHHAISEVKSILKELEGKDND
jgi:hypothetical protein